MDINYMLYRQILFDIVIFTCLNCMDCFISIYFVVGSSDWIVDINGHHLYLGLFISTNKLDLNKWVR